MPFPADSCWGLRVKGPIAGGGGSRLARVISVLILPTTKIPGCLAPLGPLARTQALLPHPSALYLVPEEVWGEGRGAGAKICGPNMACLEPGLPRRPGEGAWIGRAGWKGGLSRGLVIFLDGAADCSGRASWSL